MDLNQLAISVFNKRANEYQEKFMDVGLYKKQLDIFIERLIKDALVLELACGPGNLTKYMLSKRPDIRIFGTDLAPNMIALARKNNPSATFEIMDCREIKKLTANYDAVICGFCLPYLSRAEAIQLIKDSADLLNKQGKFYLSTMEDDHMRSGIHRSSQGDELFMYYHESKYLMAAMEEKNLNVIHLSRIECPAQDGTTNTDLVIIAEK